MARILISCFSPIEEQGAPTFYCMYEGLFRALEQEGNQVLVINSAYLVVRAWNSTNELLPHIDEAELVRVIGHFDPELTFAFNHSIPQPVLDLLECPIVLWGADTLEFFNDKHIIKQNFSRYYFFCFSHWDIRDAIEFGAPRERIFFMPSATAVEAKPVEQDKNVSFIGTMFQNQVEVKAFLKDYPDRADRDRILALVRQGYDATHEPFILERREAIERYIQLPLLFSINAPRKRIEVINAVSDLGLSLFGPPNWNDASTFFPDIAAAYVPQPVFSLAHNQDIYNSSKLCLNVSHTQVVDGYAWRVMDVMASNGCLFSDRQPGIAALLKDYIDLPMYETPGEARDLAMRLLADESHRRAIVEASQRCIEDKGRWNQRFAEMEGIVSLKLLNRENGAGSVMFLAKSLYHPDLTVAPAAAISVQGHPLKKSVRHIALMVLPPIVSRLIAYGIRCVRGNWSLLR